MCFRSRDRLAVQPTKVGEATVCLKPGTGDSKSITGSKQTS